MFMDLGKISMRNMKRIKRNKQMINAKEELLRFIKGEEIESPIKK